MAQVAIITASDSGSAKSARYYWRSRGLILALPGTPDERGGRKDTARKVVSHGVRAEIVQLDLGNLPEGALALEKLIQRRGVLMCW